MNYVARRAVVDDIPSIISMGCFAGVFTVSDRIHFYEEGELREWISQPHENILLVVENSTVLAGFLFCKVMSYHWAFLDNFYILPQYRNQHYSQILFKELQNELKKKRLIYLSTLVRQNDKVLSRYIRMNGFHEANAYQWYELFLR